MKKVLVVEDDAFISKIIVGELMKRGYDVHAAMNGDAGIAEIRAFMPDIVLLDLLMPGTDGYTVLQTVKADPATAGIPIMVCSNFGQPDEVKRVKDLGALDFVVKVNFTPKEIAAKVALVLDSAPTPTPAPVTTQPTNTTSVTDVPNTPTPAAPSAPVVHLPTPPVTPPPPPMTSPFA